MVFDLVNEVFFFSKDFLNALIFTFNGFLYALLFLKLLFLFVPSVKGAGFFLLNNGKREDRRFTYFVSIYDGII